MRTKSELATLFGVLFNLTSEPSRLIERIGFYLFSGLVDVAAMLSDIQKDVDVVFDSQILQIR